MRLRSPRLIILAVCAALLVLFIAVLGLLRLVTGPTVTVTWSAPSSGFSTTDQHSIEDSLRSALLAAGRSQSGTFTFAIEYSQRQNDQAIMSVVVSDLASGSVMAAEPLFVIARHQSGGWSVWIPASSGFCDQVRQLPPALFDPTDSQFLGC